MSFSALVIGFGSIGRRHAELLQAMDDVSGVTVLSSQKELPFETISALKDIPDLNPDYVVVASPTNQHHAHLRFLDTHLNGKTILVEKPLFADEVAFEVKNNDVFVAYNLRFHPLLQKVRDAVAGRALWTVHAFCGSYLPNWRPDRDYRDSSSAQKDSGGGVLLDLSHELDYIQWILGPLAVDYAVSRKVSDLSIETDDLLVLDGRAQGGAYVHVTLNYFTREPVRQIIIDGEGVSLRGDLIANTLSLTMDGVSEHYSWPDMDRNTTYRAQHRALLDGAVGDLCSFAEGLRTMNLIREIRGRGEA